MSALATKAVHIQVMSRTASALFQYSQPPNAVSGQARTYCGVASFAFCHPIKCVRNDATSVLSPTEGVVAYCGASAARELGLAASLREVPSMALGSNELTLLDLTRAFASVRAGRKLEPWGIAAFGPDGGSIRSLGAPAVKGHSLQQSDTMVRLLREVVARGTGRAAARVLMRMLGARPERPRTTATHVHWLQ